MKKILLGLLGCIAGTLPCALLAQPVSDHIVATLPPLAGVVQLLLPNAHPVCLLTGSGDPHHLTISPRKAEQLRTVQLLVRSSGDDGGWSGLRSVHGTISNLWPQGHHPWLVPSDIIAVLPSLADTLIQQQMLTKGESRAKIAEATTRLHRLDTAWQRVLLPLQQRGVIMQHPSWQRLLNHYKVPVRAVLEASHHGNGVTPRQLEHALALLRSDHPPLLIREQSHDSKMIDWLTHRVPSAQVVTLDALGRCGEAPDHLAQKNIQQMEWIAAQ